MLASVAAFAVLIVLTATAREMAALASLAPFQSELPSGAAAGMARMTQGPQ